MNKRIKRCPSTELWRRRSLQGLIEYLIHEQLAVVEWIHSLFPWGGGWGVYLDLVSRQQSVFCVYLQMLDAGTFGRNSPSFWESERERSRKFNMDAIIMTHICSQEAYLLHMSNDSCFLNRASQLRMSTAEVHREYVSIFMLSHQKCFGCCFKKRALQICFNLYSV